MTKIKYNPISFAAVLCLLLLGISDLTAAEDPLVQQFISPPDSAKPYTWWHWMNGNVTKEGITADLEAMERVGIGGFQAFHIGRRGTPAGPVGYMSEKWRDMMSHAIHEADRLGLEVCLHNCAGWTSSGGPWITPEKSMKRIVWAVKKVEGPSLLDAELPQPKTELNYYKEIAVLAFPTPPSELEGEGFRLSDWKAKAGFERKVNLKPDERKIDSRECIKKNQIHILNDRMNPAGQLNWNVPEGSWTIIRFGYTSTGRINKPAPPEGEGLECDKLDPAAAEWHWKNTIQNVIDDAGPLPGHVFNNVLIDSFEAGSQNWTGQFSEEFRRRMGYDLLEYLPVLTGRVIESIDISERFLWDFRRVIGDMFTDYYFGTFAQMCHRNGMVLSIEGYSDHGGNFDEFAVTSKADIPMAEWWALEQGWHHSTAKLASSIAHTYDRKVIGAEAFTTWGARAAFVLHPSVLKSQGDYFFCKGVNRFIFHTFAHQPWQNVYPGMTMGPYGMQFHRNNTWFEKSSAWLKYLARCQYLLQEGQFVADLCYFVGEESPAAAPIREEIIPAVPAGYDYDFCTVEILHKMSVEDGALVIPGGMRYRVLVLPSVPMRPNILETIKKLVEEGATVYGDYKPTTSPGLSDYPVCDQNVQKLADALWDGNRIIREKPLEDVLRGMGILPDFEFSDPVPEGFILYPGSGIEYIHRRIDTADVYFISNQHQQPAQINAIFRVQGKQPELWCPQTGHIKDTPWYVFTEKGLTLVPLSLESAGSVFVILRKTPEKKHIKSIDFLPCSKSLEKPSFEVIYQGDQIKLTTATPGRYIFEKSDGNKEIMQVETISEPKILEGPWKLHFPAGWDAPDQMEMDELSDWTTHNNYDIRHFSGTATYTKTFEMPTETINSDEAIWLDLGTVHVIAQVRLNDKNLGILWKPPFRVDITDIISPGVNYLEIEVTNLWVNRLIGDEKYEPDYLLEEDQIRGGRYLTEFPTWLLKGEKPPVGRKTFTTRLRYKKDDPLLPSGLVGPVKLVFHKNRILKL